MHGLEGEIRSLSFVGRSLNLNLNQDDSIPINPSLGRVIPEQSLSFFFFHFGGNCGLRLFSAGEGQPLSGSLDRQFTKKPCYHWVPIPIPPFIESRIELLPMSKFVYFAVHKCRNYPSMGLLQGNFANNLCPWPREFAIFFSLTDRDNCGYLYRLSAPLNGRSRYAGPHDAKGALSRRV
jgi:hypothetical protein